MKAFISLQQAGQRHYLQETLKIKKMNIKNMDEKNMNENKKYIDKDKKYLSEPNMSNGLKIFLIGCTIIPLIHY